MKKYASGVFILYMRMTFIFRTFSQMRISSTRMLDQECCLWQMQVQIQTGRNFF